MKSTCMKVLALSVLATVASTKSISEVMKGFFRGPPKIDDKQVSDNQWP